jgi:NAD(P)-dependent dehydrogenase (short-subunit alcohol dehydrogenase family)
MQINLKGKRALVTGSTAGIGYAIALGLAKAGADIVINGRKQEVVDTAIRNLRAEAPDSKVTGVAADLGTAAGVQALVAAVPKVDILVNNVGIFALQDFFDLPDSEWQRFFEINVMSGVRLSRAYMPQMMAQNWGRVIFISSESGVNIPTDMIHYGFSKTAQLAVSRGLAKRAAGTGVTVNAVLPGPTLSDGVEALLQRMAADGDDRPIETIAADFVRQHRPSSIIQRAAKVEEVANMVVYVASPQASATTGAALRVDGGVVETIV